MPTPIAELGPAIIGDFYGVTGQGIPATTKLVFQTGVVTVTVTPKVVRPHWVFVPKLPNTVPLGPSTLTLKTSGWSSASLNVNVTADPRPVVRVLYPGANKAAPYTIVFVANPAVAPYSTASSSAAIIQPDPVLTERTRFQTAVGNTLKQLVRSNEDLLQQFDDQIRFVSIFDAAAPATDAAALLKQIQGSTDTLDPRPDRVAPFLQGYGVAADVVFVVHDDGQFTEPRSQFTTDDRQQAFTQVDYDGVARRHYHFALVPGAVALPLGTESPSALHEFCHAASDYDNGLVIDLYNDEALPGHEQDFTVNKKWRNRANDPVPAGFATYQNVNYSSDPARNDHGGYERGWKSYHPQLFSVTRMNLMDYYWDSPTPASCRLDRLTRAWLSERLRAKVNR
jgi:hypothetical protein